MEVQVQITEAVIRRFERKVDRRQPGECWPWTGTRNSKGYGRIALGGRFHTASRVAWAIANKAPFPSDKLALHKCDNPPCCNPDHIWPGTAAENSADMKAKGRSSNSQFERTGLRAYNAARAIACANSTYCPKGHLRDDKNTIRRDGKLFCRVCAKIKSSREDKARRTRLQIKFDALDTAHAALIEIAGNGDGSGRNPQLMVDAAVAALAKIEGISA